MDDAPRATMTIGTKAAVLDALRQINETCCADSSICESWIGPAFDLTSRLPTAQEPTEADLLDWLWPSSATEIRAGAELMGSSDHRAGLRTALFTAVNRTRSAEPAAGAIRWPTLHSRLGRRESVNRGSSMPTHDQPRASAVERATRAAALATRDIQERNRLWWEQLPMTYEPWEGERRTPVTRDDFERLNATYLGANPWIPENVKFGGFRGKRVLEIGCGAGTASVAFASGGALVTAVDLTDAAIAMTKENARLHGVELTAIRMDAEQLGFPDASFDYVYSWGVIHHSSQPARIFAHVARVLAPGGRGLVMVYNRHSMRYYLLGLIWLVARGKIFQGYSLSTVQRFFTDGYHQRHYRPAELRAELARHGLRVDRTSISYMARRMVPGLPRPLDEWLKKRVGWLLTVEFVKA